MIIVTGGAGFIGSALVWGLNQRGYNDIVIVDLMDSSPKWKNLVKRRFRTLLDRDELFPWLEREKKNVEFVFHMGACSSTTEKDMNFLLSNNVHYSLRLLEFCARFDIPIVYASSGATYGLGGNGFSDDPSKVHTLRPINPYGFSKQLVDVGLLQAEVKPHYWYGLKFFNVYGPQEYHKKEMMSLIPKAYTQIKKTGKLQLFKSYREGMSHGEQKRDFIYVKDVVDVMMHIWSHHRTLVSGIYNVGSGVARSFLDLGNAVFEALGTKAQFEWIEMPDDIRDQYQYFTEARVEGLRGQLKYTKSFTTLEAGVKDYVGTYLNRDDPFL